MKYGDTEVSKIEEFSIPAFKARELLPDWTDEAVAPHMHWLAPNFFMPATDQLMMSSHSWLIRTRHHTILIDTCIGNEKNRPGGPLFHMQQSSYLSRFLELGISPLSIDYVMCTHLHADHVGWNTMLQAGVWVPTFPNAKYIMSKTDFNSIASGQGSGGPIAWAGEFYEDSIMPVVRSGQHELVEGTFEIIDNLRIEPAPGHSEGHQMFVLNPGRGECLFVGDVVHHPIQVYKPDWSSSFCSDPLLAVQTRRGILERAVENGSRLFPAHFTGESSCCIINRHGSFACVGIDD